MFVRDLFQRYQVSDFVFWGYEILEAKERYPPARPPKYLLLSALTRDLARTFVVNIQTPLRKIHINVPKILMINFKI